MPSLSWRNKLKCIQKSLIISVCAIVSHDVCPHTRPLIAIAIKRVLDHAPDVGQFMEYVMATGNLKSHSGLGLQQVSQCTVEWK